MNRKRLIAALLATATLITSLAACANNEETTPESTSATAVTEEVGTEELKSNLPSDLNYGDDEVAILSRYREGWTSGEIAVEKNNTGDVVNDAVYQRNKLVEEQLKIKIVNLAENDANPEVVINKVTTAVNSNTDEYDIVAGACYVTVAASLSNTFADLRSTKYLDFAQPWWSQGFNEVVEYKGAQFAVTGSALLSMYRFAFVTLFNKRLFDEAKVPYLYDSVRDGSWTLDKQIEMVPVFHQDNGNADKEDDIYGLVTTDYISVDPYWSSCKVDIIQKNEDGDYEMVFESGKLHSVADKILQLYYGTDNSTYNYKHYGLDEEQNDIRKMFAEGNAAMATLRLMELENGEMRSMTDGFGVAPMPKYDEQQTEYRTLLHDQFTVLAVPSTIQGERLDQMSAVLEAMSFEGYRLVKPAYYESALRYKYMKDPDSWEMMDIITNNIYIDAGIIYTNTLSSFHDRLRKIVGNKVNTVVSDYRSLQTQANKALKEQLVQKLDKIIENNQNQT